MVNELFKDLSNLEQVEAIALGGSRSGNNYDDKSDYDIYLYCTDSIDEQVRNEILRKYCDVIELGNHYWEYEDNCTLKNGIDIDILYRNLDDFIRDVENVVEKYQVRNGYTTCMWHNLKTCKVIYDRHGRLTGAKERFDVNYPEQLKKNIITRNMNLLSEAMPAYKYQIAKAIERNDRVSINHRTTAFLESYFDILFALNNLTHPGEKRLINICKEQCLILPDNFEMNLNKLFKDISVNIDMVNKDIDNIVLELKKKIVLHYKKVKHKDTNG